MENHKSREHFKFILICPMNKRKKIKTTNYGILGLS